jgi:hypothetical protein
VAKQDDMTVSGAWSRFEGLSHQSPNGWVVGSRFFPVHLDQNLAVGVRAAVADHLGRAPTRAELAAARPAAHSLAGLGRAHMLHAPGADVDTDTGDRIYLVLAKPNVIMNECRRRRRCDMAE